MIPAALSIALLLSSAEALPADNAAPLFNSGRQRGAPAPGTPIGDQTSAAEVLTLAKAIETALVSNIETPA